MKEQHDSLALFSKVSNEGSTCSACGKNGHSSDKCWFVVGFLAWHPKSISGKSTQNQSSYKGKEKSFHQQKWNNNKPKTIANVSSNSNGTIVPTVSTQQIEQLMKLLPTPSKYGGPDTDEEMDTSYAGMVL